MELSNNTIEECLLNCILSTGTVVSIESITGVVKRILRVASDPLSPRAELGDPGALGL